MTPPERGRRGALTDEALAILHRCFDEDEVEINGQRFLFLPRPPRPPIFVGGSGAHALRRAARLADGWTPGNVEPRSLREPIRDLHELARQFARNDRAHLRVGVRKRRREETVVAGHHAARSPAVRQSSARGVTGVRSR